MSWGIRRKLWWSLLATIGVVGSLLVAPNVGAAGDPASLACVGWDLQPGSAIRLDVELAGTVDTVTRDGADCATGTLALTLSELTFGHGLASGEGVVARITADTVTVSDGRFHLNPAIHDGPMVIDPTRNGGVITARADGRGVKLTGGALVPASNGPAGAGIGGDAPKALTGLSAGALAAAAAQAPDPSQILPDVLEALLTGRIALVAELTEWGIAVDLRVDRNLRVWGIIAWDGSYRFNTEVKDLPLGDPALGQGRLNATGTISGPNFDVTPTYDLAGSLTGPLGLTPELSLLGGEARITNAAITVSGAARLTCATGALDLTAGLTYRSGDDWSADVSGRVADGGCTPAEGLVLRSGELNGTVAARPGAGPTGSIVLNGSASVAALPDGLRDWTLALDGRLSAAPAGGSPISGSVKLTSASAAFDGTITPDGRFELGGRASITALGASVNLAGRVTGAIAEPDISLTGNLSARFPVGGAAEGDTVNLARLDGVTVRQSSTGWGGVAERAVDGNTDGNHKNGSVTHTANNEGADWWEIDLGARRDVHELVVHNRTDCCGARVLGGYVFLSDTPFTSTDPKVTATVAGVTTHRFGWTNAPQFRFPGGRSARYIRVQTNGQRTDDFLSIAELVVTGTRLAEVQAELTGSVTLNRDGLALTGSLAVPCGGGRAVFGVNVPRLDARGGVIDVTGRTEGACVVGGLVVDGARLAGRLTLAEGSVGFEGSVELLVGGRPVNAAITVDSSGIKLAGGATIACLKGDISVDLGAAVTAGTGVATVTGTVGPAGCELTPGFMLAAGRALEGTLRVGADGALSTTFEAAGSLAAGWLPGGATDWRFTARLAADAAGATAEVGLTSSIGSLSGTIHPDGTFRLAGAVTVTVDGTTVDAAATLVRSTPAGTPVFTASGTYDNSRDGIRLAGTASWDGATVRVKGTATIACDPGTITASVDLPISTDGTWAATVTGTIGQGGCRLGTTGIINSGSVKGTLRSNGTFDFAGSLKLRFGNVEVAAEAELVKATSTSTPHLVASGAVDVTNNGLRVRGTLSWSETGMRLAGTATIACDAGSLSGTVDMTVFPNGTWGTTVAGTVGSTGCRFGDAVVRSGSVSGSIGSSGTFNLAGDVTLAVGGVTVNAAAKLVRSTATGTPVLTASATLDNTANGLRVQGDLVWDANGLRIRGTATINCVPGVITAAIDLPIAADGTWAAKVEGTIGADGCRLGTTGIINSGSVSGTLRSNGTFEFTGALNLRFNTLEVSANAKVIKATPGATPHLEASAAVDSTTNGLRVQGTLTWNDAGMRLAGTATISCGTGLITAGVNLAVLPAAGWTASVNGTVGSGGCRIGNDVIINSGSVSGTVSSNGTFDLSGSLSLRWGATNVSAQARLVKATAAATPHLVASAAVDNTANGVRVAGTLTWSSTGIRLTGSATVPCASGSVTGTVDAAVTAADWTATVGLAVASGGCRINPNVLLTSGTFSGTLASRSGALSVAVNGNVAVTTSAGLVPYSGTTYTGSFALNAANGTVSGNVSLSGGGVSLSGAITWAGDMNWSVSASGRIQVRGSTLGFSGRVWRSGGTLYWDLSGSASNVQLGDSIWLNSGSFRWNNSNFSFNGSLRVACTSGDMNISASGWIANNNNWRFEVNTSANNCRLGRNFLLSSNPFSGWIASSNGSVSADFRASFSRWDPASDVWITNGSLQLRITDGWRFQGRIQATGGVRIWVLWCAKELSATVTADFDLSNRWTGNVRVSLSNIQIGWLHLMYQGSLEMKLRDGTIYGISI